MIYNPVYLRSGKVKKAVYNPAYVQGTQYCQYSDVGPFHAKITATINAEMLGKAYILVMSYPSGRGTVSSGFCMVIAPDLTAVTIDDVYEISSSNAVVYDAASRTFTWSFDVRHYFQTNTGSIDNGFTIIALEI